MRRPHALKFHSGMRRPLSSGFAAEHTAPCPQTPQRNTRPPVLRPRSGTHRPLSVYIPFPDTLSLEKNAAVLSAASPCRACLAKNRRFSNGPGNGMYTGRGRCVLLWGLRAGGAFRHGQMQNYSFVPKVVDKGRVEGIMGVWVSICLQNLHDKKGLQKWAE